MMVRAIECQGRPNVGAKTHQSRQEQYEIRNFRKPLEAIRLTLHPTQPQKRGRSHPHGDIKTNDQAESL
jgi:hypothetical protein